MDYEYSTSVCPFDQTKMPGLSTGCCTAAKAPLNSPKMQPSLKFEVKMLHFALGSQKTLTKSGKSKLF